MMREGGIAVVDGAGPVLGGGGIGNGIVIISGTGSVAYGRVADGREARSGGWGWLIGDDGSAAWLAREATREVMRRSDAGESPDALGEAMLEAGDPPRTPPLPGQPHRATQPPPWARP